MEKFVFCYYLVSQRFKSEFVYWSVSLLLLHYDTRNVYLLLLFDGRKFVDSNPSSPLLINNLPPPASLTSSLYLMMKHNWLQISICSQFCPSPCILPSQTPAPLTLYSLDFSPPFFPVPIQYTIVSLSFFCLFVYFYRLSQWVASVQDKCCTDSALQAAWWAVCRHQQWNDNHCWTFVYSWNSSWRRWHCCLTVPYSQTGQQCIQEVRWIPLSFFFCKWILNKA